MQMHPVICGILERVVPDCGLTLPDGRVIAPGTKVGINPWVLSRNKDVYGTDSDKFRPERWLCSENEDEDAYLARLKKMNDADLTFGSGKRVCVGRNMANLEIHKVISTLFGRYDVSRKFLWVFDDINIIQIQLDHAVKEWSPRWWWFTFIDNIEVKIQHRQNVASVELNAKDA